MKFPQKVIKHFKKATIPEGHHSHSAFSSTVTNTKNTTQ
jgi:hypothetical protein